MTRMIVIAAVAAAVAGCASPGGTGGASIVQTASVIREEAYPRHQGQIR